MTLKVAVIVGSLRGASITRKVANAMVAQAPPTMECSFVDIGDLPLYNQDLDDKPPAAWTRFRNEVKECAGVLFFTPEYNRSMPGGLKNAIDVGSRPYGQSVFDGMPAAVVSVTPHQLGAFGANHALRQAFVFLNMPAMQQPEAYIGNAEALFDEQGKLKQQDTREFFGKFIAAFEKWIDAAGRMKQQ